MVTPYERNGPALLHVHVQHLEKTINFVQQSAMPDAAKLSFIYPPPQFSSSTVSGNFDLAQKEISSTRHRFWGYPLSANRDFTTHSLHTAGAVA